MRLEAEDKNQKATFDKSIDNLKVRRDFKGTRTQDLYPRHSRSIRPMMLDNFRICSIIDTAISSKAR
jgi:hypothetical protein